MYKYAREFSNKETEVHSNETLRPRTSSPVSEKINQKNQEEGVKEMKIKLTIGQDKYTASMNDSKAAKDFIALLPMTLTLKDYAGTEKVSNLPTGLSTSGSPDGTAASIGDITYYASWGNLAIFYRNFGYASGLIKLGSIDTDGEKLAKFKKPIEVQLHILEE